MEIHITEDLHNLLLDARAMGFRVSKSVGWFILKDQGTVVLVTKSSYKVVEFLNEQVINF